MRIRRSAKRTNQILPGLPGLSPLVSLALLAVGLYLVSHHFFTTRAQPARDYSKFAHMNPKEHADLMALGNCGSCHRRVDASVAPRFPLHRDCTGCHLVQFTVANSSSGINPICTICHLAEGLTSPSAPLKSFRRLTTFSAAFDHAQHLKGIASARPSAGCAACHRPANTGVALTIPARLNAHQICYECHSPRKQASNLSSCGSCHKPGRYSPTPMSARSFRVGFSHADHSSRQRLTCDNCHTVLGRGLPQARQVRSTAPLLHQANPRGRNCLTCHDGRRAFGDARAEFNDCQRCHKGMTFRS